MDTGLGNAVSTVIQANAGIQRTVQNVLSWTPAYAGVTMDLFLQVAQANTLPIAEADSGI